MTPTPPPLCRAHICCPTPRIKTSPSPLRANAQAGTPFSTQAPPTRSPYSLSPPLLDSLLPPAFHRRHRGFDRRHSKKHVPSSTPRPLLLNPRPPRLLARNNKESSSAPILRVRRRPTSTSRIVGVAELRTEYLSFDGINRPASRRHLTTKVRGRCLSSYSLTHALDAHSAYHHPPPPPEQRRPSPPSSSRQEIPHIRFATPRLSRPALPQHKCCSPILPSPNRCRHWRCRQRETRYIPTTLSIPASPTPPPPLPHSHTPLSWFFVAAAAPTHGLAVPQNLHSANSTPPLAPVNPQDAESAPLTLPYPKSCHGRRSSTRHPTPLAPLSWESTNVRSRGDGRRTYVPCNPLLK
ncbi:hypothetical protein R3P38DRAFT_3266786 [Favolaschia claudopus]|uniref:Uncharacterized protein n=1 Tax=Favolaschia claudopus TaxID=2862362 RepID=A0AAW0BXC6_9AGAR